MPSTTSAGVPMSFKKRAAGFTRISGGDQVRQLVRKC